MKRKTPKKTPRKKNPQPHAAHEGHDCTCGGLDLSDLKFDERGLLPAITRDAQTGEVLMLAYVNREALEKTLATGQVHYYSRKRRRIWLKGETSSHFQDLVGVRLDCDGDTLLFDVQQHGVACHEGFFSCFSRALDEYGVWHRILRKGKRADKIDRGPVVIGQVMQVLEERKKNFEKRQPETKPSYVRSLYKGGVKKIAAKIREEGLEYEEALALGKRKEIIHEFTDLLFHALVGLAHQKIPFSAIEDELERRLGTSGIEEKRARK